MTGRITEIQPMRTGAGRGSSCTQMAGVQDREGNITNFMITPDTFVADCTALREGMQATFFYDAQAPAPLIYPPQFQAAAVVPTARGQNVMMAYFNRSLLSADRSLQLNLDRNTRITTANHQNFMGNPGDNVLIVVYGATTRSIPPQTTPDRIIVMCGF